MIAATRPMKIPEARALNPAGAFAEHPHPQLWPHPQTQRGSPGTGAIITLPYLWLVGNGRMVVIVVIIVPFLHSLLTKGKSSGSGLLWSAPPAAVLTRHQHNHQPAAALAVADGPDQHQQSTAVASTHPPDSCHDRGACAFGQLLVGLMNYCQAV